MTINQFIKSKIVELFSINNLAGFEDENRPLKALGINSLGYIKLIVEIENRYDIQIPDQKLVLSNATTIKDLACIVEDCVHQRCMYGPKK